MSFAADPDVATPALADRALPATQPARNAAETPFSVKLVFYAVLALLATLALWPSRRDAAGPLGA